MRESLLIASNILKVFFSFLSINIAFNVRCKCIKSKNDQFVVPVNEFIPYLQRIQQNNSEAEIRCQINSLLQTLNYNLDGIPIKELILYFSDSLITRHHENYCFSYEFCDIWRNTIVMVDEEFFVASKIAQENQRRGIHEFSNLSWPYCIEHDNRNISNILNTGQGVSDNHFHLRASSPYYLYSWIRLMSNPMDTELQKNIKKMDTERLMQRISFSGIDQNEPLYEMWIKAVAIRLYLTCFLLYSRRGLKWDDKILPFRIEKLLLSECTPLDTILKLQATINKLYFRFNSHNCSDYISINNNYGTFGELYGERWLLCNLFSSCNSNYIDSLLCCYLMIKNRFRNELVQSNGLIGFKNFFKYQDRKGWFMSRTYESEMKLTAATISGVIDGPRISSLELRIAPARPRQSESNLVVDNYNTIMNYEKSIEMATYNNDLYTKDTFYYSFHFIKSHDKQDFNDALNCRHSELRSLIELQAESILEMRYLYPNIANRIRGIDACNEEIDCRPEVFGPIFRKLLRFEVNHDTPQLQASYHVGEDNYDIVDGLRAIHEAILFLGLKTGNRIGHATMLGISVETFYKNKNMMISMPLQNYIDNLAWMYYFISKNYHWFNRISGILEYFKGKYNNAIQILYSTNGTLFDTCPSIDDYVHAWLLRGDEPYLYFVYKNCPRICALDSFRLCDTISDMELFRKRKEIRKIYHQYHFNKTIRQNGLKSISDFLIPEVIESIEIVQRVLQSIVAEKGLGIESNPSSNLLISSISKYKEHPIIRLFDNRNDKNNHQLQLSVSVNTDDRSVFSTSISNEYAYLAYDLENMLDENHNKLYSKADIYKWLELLKNNGNAQAFRNLDYKKRRLWH